MTKGKTKCKEKEGVKHKPSHKFECNKCRRTANKKARLCKAQKMHTD